ncbi:uncharacterized protein BDZ99DRAFT_462003 [Mytilinidion resinicola]|uniref:Uncharacterized protein n=1 Tax=Mytilinidion resinicola TaxID=574789 RepID=A0A6A6YPG4_9PEZI|nr:uncharacterized protein BDZ99DRAFT_462003 [Mytilinidion resinicola]KAF2810641.1 hypothetical protein BDZ99DRAFT_462003 [Mytilinidion resinicola]
MFPNFLHSPTSFYRTFRLQCFFSTGITPGLASATPQRLLSAAVPASTLHANLPQLSHTPVHLRRLPKSARDLFTLTLLCIGSISLGRQYPH